MYILPVCRVDNGLEVGSRLEVNTGVCTVTNEQSSKTSFTIVKLLMSRLQMVYIIVKPHDSKKETILNPEWLTCTAVSIWKLACLKTFGTQLFCCHGIHWAYLLKCLHQGIRWWSAQLHWLGSLEQGLNYLFLTLPNSDSGRGKHEKFTMALKRFHNISEVSGSIQ